MTNKKLKMAAMSVALTACVAASPLAANADAPEAAPQEKEPVAEETKKEEMWGDRIFEKCGIRRDEGGDGGKTLEIRGKRRLSARDRGANYQQS